MCRPLQDTRANASCSTFSRPAPDGCPDFSTYKLGLGGLSQSGSPYLKQSRVTDNQDALSAAYLQKSILYVFGGADTCNCNTEGYSNPSFCIREADGQSRGCKPSVAGPTCCDMPNGKVTNSFVDVSCGEMIQVGGRRCCPCDGLLCNCSALCISIQGCMKAHRSALAVVGVSCGLGVGSVGAGVETAKFGYSATCCLLLTPVNFPVDLCHSESRTHGVAAHTNPLASGMCRIQQPHCHGPSLHADFCCCHCCSRLLLLCRVPTGFRGACCMRTT